MMKEDVRNSLLSVVLLVGILPSLLGVHVFEHFCTCCDGNEFSASLISSTHQLTHECPACECDHGCKECYSLTGKHVHHTSEKDCSHKYQRIEDDFQVSSFSFKFKAAQVDLLLPQIPEWTLVDKEFKKHSNSFCNVILKIPDEPSPEKNCVFLL